MSASKIEVEDRSVAQLCQQVIAGCVPYLSQPRIDQQGFIDCSELRYLLPILVRRT